MSNYTVTVIKTGNSFALRVPKSYVDAAALQLGEQVQLPLPQRAREVDPQRIQQLIAKLQASQPYREITDPVMWQRSQRADRPIPSRD